MARKCLESASHAAENAGEATKASRSAISLARSARRPPTSLSGVAGSGATFTTMDQMR